MVETAATQAEYLKDSIILLTRARDHAVEDYRTAQEAGTLDAVARHDYELFIEYLNTRILSYCSELGTASESTTLEGLPCPPALDTGTGVSVTPVLPSPESITTDEHLAELDASLTSALGRFDDMLLKEQEQLAAHVPRQQESGSSSTESARTGTGSERQGGETTGEQGQGEQGTESGAGEGQQGRAGEQSDSQYEQGTTSGEKRGQSGGGGDGKEMKTGRETSSREEAIDADDDDIVARQLREAAEKETDPEVKKKLWEEYRKYKEGTR